MDDESSPLKQLGKLLGQIRTEYKERNAKDDDSFAEHTGTKRSTYSNNVSGLHLPRKATIQAVKNTFPEYGPKLERLFDAAKKQKLREDQAKKANKATVAASTWPSELEVVLDHKCRWLTGEQSDQLKDANQKLKASQRAPAERVLRKITSEPPGAVATCTPCLAQAHRQLGESLASHDGLAKGLFNFRRAIELTTQRDPAIAALHVDRLAWLLADDGQLDEAVTVVQDAIRTLHHNGRLWRRLGILRWHQQRPEDAIALVEQAARDGVPRALDAFLSGQIYFELGWHEEALAKISFAVDSPINGQPSHVARRARAAVYATCGDMPNAQDDFRKEPNNDCDDALFHYFTGVYFSKVNETKQAAEAYHHALEYAQSRSGVARPATSVGSALSPQQLARINSQMSK